MFRAAISLAVSSSLTLVPLSALVRTRLLSIYTFPGSCKVQLIFVCSVISVHINNYSRTSRSVILNFFFPCWQHLCTSGCQRDHDRIFKENKKITSIRLMLDHFILVYYAVFFCYFWSDLVFLITFPFVYRELTVALENAECGEDASALSFTLMRRF